MTYQIISRYSTGKVGSPAATWSVFVSWFLVFVDSIVHITYNVVKYDSNRG
jgi:hypothetical protein